MMARVALGHTGRPLAPPRLVVWAFAAVTFAAVARVVAPLLDAARYLPALVVAGGFWTAAFMMYLVAYAPILVSPRVDGKPG
jgi:uncharacterized protein involved in response to NO